MPAHDLKGTFIPSEELPMEHNTRVFDPEATQSLCIAFDKVCSTVADRDRSEFVKELIARKVIALAERGERDPDKLAQATTSSLGLRGQAISH
jgi:hypothetical protein